jgi:dihydroxy-acid dehydratase
MTRPGLRWGVPGGGPPGQQSFRSQKWLRGDDEVALANRVALTSAGVPAGQGGPVIGIANSASQLNPCNLPLRQLAVAVAEGVRAAGGAPAEFPTISLGEDLMKPSAMLYRNLLAIEVEEMVRANPLDGLVVLANCDKSVPGALMGAISANVPTVLVTGGARPRAMFRGRALGAGTDLWRMWDERRAGRLDDAGWRELEEALGQGCGACNTMGTASTMAVLAEALGLMVPGAASIPAGDPRGLEAAARAGRVAVEAVLHSQDTGGRRPQDIVTPAAVRNAIRVLHAVGGSTNAIIHLAAMAGRAGAAFPLEDIARLGADMPVLADVEPSGAGLMQDFDAAGGVPALLRELGDRLDTGARTVTGQTIGEIAAAAPPVSGAIRPATRPLRSGGAFAVVRGSLAPEGAVIKVSAASPELLTHRGPAVVFRDYDDMRRRVADPDLPVTPDSVLVMAGCGPSAGMPEWGMVPIPAALVAAGVTDMVRVTDSRMSGTSFGTVVLHVAPEAAAGGPLALVQDGDMIALDAAAGSLELEVAPEELARRAAAWSPPPPAHLRGWPALYARTVQQAPQGCDLDFLTAPSPEHRKFIEPVVGRS